MYFEIPGSNVRVLGSMHLVPVGAVAAPPWALAAYDWCDVLVHEHSKDDSAWLVRADRPLREVIGTDTWRELEAAVTSPWKRDYLDGLRPWAAALHVSVWAQQVALGVESALLQRCAIDGKRVDVLETIADVRAAFDSTPLPDVERVITACVRDIPHAQERLLRLHAAWQARDRAAMHAIAADSPFGACAAMWESGIARRNQAWALKLEPLLAASPRTLVVVGALHLCGPGNLEECLDVRFRPI